MTTTKKLLRKLALILCALPVRRRPYLKPSIGPIFIIGSPRSGSTFLYQKLTNTLNYTYISNLASLFYKNLVIGIYAHKLIFNNKPHENFKSTFGNTTEFGLNAPSECGPFWYRWLTEKKHFIDYDDFNQETIKQISNEIFRCVEINNSKPFLFKNLAMGQRLRLIHKTFPNAKLIYIKRNHSDIVTSLTRARAALKISKNKLWSIKPKQHHDLTLLSEPEMLQQQIIRLEEQISKDLTLFPEQNTLIVEYEEFNDDLFTTINDWCLNEN